MTVRVRKVSFPTTQGFAEDGFAAAPKALLAGDQVRFIVGSITGHSVSVGGPDLFFDNHYASPTAGPVNGIPLVQGMWYELDRTDFLYGVSSGQGLGDGPAVVTLLELD